MARGFTLTVDKKTKALLDKATARGYVAQVRKEFSKRGPIKVKQAIIQDMIRGISPVHGQGKWKKYSASYKDAIKGNAAFFTGKNGKVVAIRKDGGVSNKELKQLRASKGARKSLKGVRDRNAKFIESHNKHLAGKRISPVNLRLTGDLHRSSFSKSTGGFLTSFRLLIGFKSKLADIHNRLGAGKSKVVRRILPTKGRERFNNRITNALLLELQKAADIVAKKFSGQ